MTKKGHAGLVTPGWPTAVYLGLLLVLPILALARLTPWVDWRVLVGAPLAMSVFTFFSYRIDKRRAESGEWRVEESALHLTELLGGWPGAFLAQRIYRHKTAKRSFQLGFWAIVLIQQLVALDFLLHWQLTMSVLHAIKP